jgi:hypothetical protein
MAAPFTELKIALKLYNLSDSALKDTYFFDSARQQLTADWVRYRFAYVISQTPAVKGVTPNVSWSFKQADITETDLVCYIVGTTADSIIKSKSFATPANRAGALDAGLTVIGDARGNLSEVYLTGKVVPKELANIICHELMHNKCKLDNSMHSKPNVNMGASPTGEGNFIAAGDLSLLKPVLATKVKQYTDLLDGVAPGSTTRAASTVKDEAPPTD